MNRKSLALDWVALDIARRYFLEYGPARSDIKSRCAGFGGTVGKALTDAIARGNLSPITLDDLEHGCMADVYRTPFGVVILLEG